LQKAGIARGGGLKIAKMFFEDPTKIPGMQGYFTHRQCGCKPGKPGILGKFSKARKLTELSGNSVQPRKKIVTNKIVLQDAVSRVHNCINYQKFVFGRFCAPDAVG